jgi:diguanylate cyclase (GGDEF)-like protein/PAS domain S-box-containing protein
MIIVDRPYLLSLISLFCSYSFVISGVYIYRLNKVELINRLAVVINWLFAIWSFCNTFFFSAPNQETAWFWHKLSALGWIPFCAFVLHFYAILSGHAPKRRITLTFIYAIPAVLLAHSLFGESTPVARGLVQSESGWGWTYVSALSSPWFIFYTVYLASYMIMGHVFLDKWRRSSKRPVLRKQALFIIVLDIPILAAACYFDLAAPALRPVFPPLASIIVFLWTIGLVTIVRKYKMMTIYEAANADFLFEALSDPVLLLDSKGIILKYNRATSNLLKCPYEEILGKPFSTLLKSGKYDRKKTSKLLRDKKLNQVQFDVLDSRKKVIHTLTSVSLVENKPDGLLGFVVSIHDITRHKATEIKLRKREDKYRALSGELFRVANYDKLTSMPNRRFFFQALDAALTSHSSNGLPFSLLFLDLDGFKDINDTYGHDVGDALLIGVAKRMQENIRDMDIVARIGGDEFIVLLLDPESVAESDALADRLDTAFHTAFLAKRIVCYVGVSIGMSQFPDDGKTVDDLLKSADQRMYALKKLRKKDEPHVRHFAESLE